MQGYTKRKLFHTHFPYILILSAAILCTALIPNSLSVKEAAHTAGLVSTSPFKPIPTAGQGVVSPKKTLTFEEQNTQYGPCTRTPALMYHHIETEAVAKEQGFSGLSVSPEIFRQQMEYLKQEGYVPVSITQLNDFFDKSIPLPRKSILITFDDGYEDLYIYGYPILKEFGFNATAFIPTGLLQNPGYLTWQNIHELADSTVFYIANHTWSHKSVASTPVTIAQEISTAELHLEQNNLNSQKVFAYPYGSMNHSAVEYLNTHHYTLAFSTQPGSILCKRQRLALPRIRIGKERLEFYGL